MKYRRKEVINAITFEEFVEYGKNNGGNIVNGMPWSFSYDGLPITHENDKCYLIGSTGGVRFTPEDVLITDDKGSIYPYSKALLNKYYEPAE